MENRLGCNVVEHCLTHMRPWVQASLLVEGKQTHWYNVDILLVLTNVSGKVGILMKFSFHDTMSWNYSTFERSTKQGKWIFPNTQVSVCIGTRSVQTTGWNLSSRCEWILSLRKRQVHLGNGLWEAAVCFWLHVSSLCIRTRQHFLFLSLETGSLYIALLSWNSLSPGWTNSDIHPPLPHGCWD